MNRRVITTVFFFILMSTIYAQSSELMVEGITPSLHLAHKVAAKETWYSIGKMYNLSPKEIATNNNLTIDKALAIGQQLKVPLVASNFAQSPFKLVDEVYVPVYHIVKDKEWMYRVSVNYNKVPVEYLEKWNSVGKDQVKSGMKLIVGYLKVKKAQSALASKGSSTMKITQAADAVISNKPSAPAEQVVVKVEPSPKPEVTKSEVTKPEAPKQEPKVIPQVIQETKPVVRIESTEGGYFKSMFAQSGKNNAGSAGVFKSTSGWEDGKYYALMNNVPVGTIIKVAAANKVVYAKVLGQLAEMKENSGLAVRLSDAAAAQLGSGETSRFPVEVMY